MKIRQVKKIIGGKVVILECEDNPKLISLYEKHAFQLLNVRKEDELKTMFIIPDI